jgi:hypothetical protein
MFSSGCSNEQTSKQEVLLIFLQIMFNEVKLRESSILHSC